MPISMTPTQVADFWRINQIDATRCVVMHVANGTFVGMARMGTRATRGWCGGFGIVPAFRGTGASTLLAHEMIRVARESGLAQLQLEVLSQNVPARKLYECVGFVTQRRLLGLEIATSALPDALSSSFTCERVPIETLSSWPQELLPRPCWGNELTSLLTMGSEMLVMPGSDGRKNAIIARRSGEKFVIQTVLPQSEFTDVELATLLRAVAGDATMIQVFNEPEESPTLCKPWHDRIFQSVRDVAQILAMLLSRKQRQGPEQGHIGELASQLERQSLTSFASCDKTNLLHGAPHQMTMQPLS